MRRPALHVEVGDVEGRALEAGEHPVVALGVVARAVVDGAQDGEPVHPLRLLGQQLAELHAGDAACGWPRTARGTARRRRASGPTSPCGPGPPLSQNRMTAASGGGACCLGPGPEEIGERQPADAEHAGLDEAAARQAAVAIHPEHAGRLQCANWRAGEPGRMGLLYPIPAGRSRGMSTRPGRQADDRLRPLGADPTRHAALYFHWRTTFTCRPDGAGGGVPSAGTCCVHRPPARPAPARTRRPAPCPGRRRRSARAGCRRRPGP